ncbi:MAG: S8 family peptidase [bacterium]
MFNQSLKSINTKVALLIALLIILLINAPSYAQTFMPNELNIKISKNIVKEGNAGDYILSLSSELEKDLKYADQNLEVRIKKIFSESDPESQLSCWYKIRFISESNLNLDDIRKKILENFEHVIDVEKEYITKSRIVPNDFVIGQMSYDYYSLIGAYEAWDIEKGRTDVIVALIDSGVNVNHPDLVNRFVSSSLFKRYPPDSSIDPSNPTEECYLYKGNIYCFDIYIDSEELNNGSLPPDNDVRDVVPHGTPITGIIAANHNTIGIPGICPNCKILPIKASYLEHLVEQSGTISPYTEGTSTTGTISSAVEYAAKNGADVINLSMSTSSDTSVLEDAVNYAYERYNCILVAPGDNADEEDEAYPAAYNNVIGVTAIKVDSQNRVLKRTNAQYGTWIDVVAPGDNIFSLTLESNSIKTYSGTSLSVPFVTGLAALVRSMDSNFTIHNFRQLLRESSTPIDDPLYDAKKLGYGLINLRNALYALDDHLWDYSGVTQQGNTSTSGVNTTWPIDPGYINLYPYGFSSYYPFGTFGGYMSPAYNTYNTLLGGGFGSYYQQPYYSNGYSSFYPYSTFGGYMSPAYNTFNTLLGGGFGSYYQRPYYSSSYSPYSISSFSQYNPVFQRYSPYGGFGGGMFSPYLGSFGGSPLVIFSFPLHR